MKKLKLDLENLKVESFETVNDKSKKQGTVYGNVTQTQLPSNCSEPSCVSGPCASSCETDGCLTCYTEFCGCSGTTCETTC